MMVGLNVSATDYASHFTAFAHPALCRVFAPAGAGMPDWAGTAISTLPPTVIPHVSFKDWRDDCSHVLAWLDRIPASVPFAWVTYHHEPEGDPDFDPSEYRRRWGLLHQAVTAHRNGRRITLVPIQTLQWTTNTAAGKGRGDPFLWWAGVDTPFVGMDCYVDSWATSYPDPQTFLAPLLRLSAGVGRPFVIPELGSVRLAGDTDGTRRAAWIRKVAAELRAHDCRAVSWWCATGANNRDFHLSDAPSHQAWQDVLLGRV